MRLKRIMALALAGVMAAGLVGCSSGSEDETTTTTTAASDEAAETTAEETTTIDYGDTTDTLVIWTLAADLQQFADYYTEQTGNKTVVTVIEPADYPQKIATALQGGDTTADIIVGEPQMLQDMYDQEFFANLDELGASDYEGQIVDYVWQVGKDSDGIQRTISYQITPAGFYYRRDIAKKVFGTDDPDEVGKLFADYPTILDTAQKLKDAGYKIFASDSELSYFSGDEAWVVDDALNLADSRIEYMDLVNELYNGGYTAFAAQWTAPWYLGMAGELPILTADEMEAGTAGEDGASVWDKDSFVEATEGYETTEVFAYGLPAWGVLTLRDNVGDTSGNWGVCSGPAYGFGGGTFIGISNLSTKKDMAWDFIKFVTLNEDTADWWIEKSEGDTVSLISALEKHKDDENAVYGNQKLYAFWQEQAKGIDYSKVTKYDTAIGDLWGQAISAVKKGDKDKKTAIAEFKDAVQSAYPDLTVE